MLIIEDREPQQTGLGVSPARPHGTKRHLVLQENAEDFRLCRKLSNPYYMWEQIGDKTAIYCR